MNWIALLSVFMFGFVLSGLYFGGLWITVQRIQDVQHPARLLVISFLVRAALVLSGFYLLLRWIPARWELIGGALLGFLVGRGLLIRRWRPQRTDSTTHSLLHGN